MTGVRREVFELMVDAVDTAKSEARKHPTRGRPAKIGNADKLLLLLMYYREYRTMLHTGASYGVSESRTCEIPDRGWPLPPAGQQVLGKGRRPVRSRSGRRFGKPR